MQASSQGALQTQASMRSYWIVLIIGWCIGALYLGVWGYGDSFLRLNALRWGPADRIMPHLTHIGDGFLMSGILGIYLSLRAPKFLPILAITMLLVWALVTVGKQVLFADWDRPLKYFEDPHAFYTISIDRIYHHAFPSGHSASVAGVVSVFAFSLVPFRRWTGVLLAVVVIIGSYTRLYIGVHFLGDIVVGSMLGCGIAWGTHYFWHRWTPALWPKRRPFWPGFVISAILLGLSVWNLYQTFYDQYL